MHTGGDDIMNESKGYLIKYSYKFEFVRNELAPTYHVNNFSVINFNALIDWKGFNSASPIKCIYL